MPAVPRRSLPRLVLALAISVGVVAPAATNAAAAPQFLNKQYSDAVHGLRHCLDTLPDKQRRLVVLRSGIGPRDPASAQAVAAATGIPAATVAAAQWQAVRQMRAAQDAGQCPSETSSATQVSSAPGSPAAKVAPAHTTTEHADAGAELTEPRSLLLLALIGLCLVGLGRELLRALRI